MSVYADCDVCKRQGDLCHICSEGKLWKSESFYYKVRHLPVYINLKIFSVTEFNEMFMAESHVKT